MRITWFYSVLAAAACLAAPALLAADDAPGDERESLFKKLDANQDGALTSDEIPEEQQRLFKRLLGSSDKDHNGQLSREEFLAGTAQEARPREQDAPAGQFEPAEIFKRLDANNDGKLVESEVPEERRQGFVRLIEVADSDGDNALTIVEFSTGMAKMRSQGAPGGQQGNAGPGAEAIFKHLDANSDGKVTIDEVPEERREGFAKMLERGDGNNDQALSMDEFRKVFVMGGGRRPEGSPSGDRRPPGDEGRPPPPATAGTLFRVLDVDADGTISREEIYASAEALKALDKDGNGSISRGEAGLGPDMMAQAGRRPNSPPPGGPGGQQPDVRAMIERNDKNGDGKLSKDEAPEWMARGFDRMDTNKDGVLDEAELKQSAGAMRGAGQGGGRPGAPGGAGGGQFFKVLDKNGDGKLTKDEVPDRMRENFDRMDANMDGSVDQSEFQQAAARMQGGGAGRPGGARPAGGAGGGGAGRFKELDKNGDGKLSRDEVPDGMRDNFDRIDTNSDGSLDASEVQKAMEAMRGRQGDKN